MHAKPTRPSPFNNHDDNSFVAAVASDPAAAAAAAAAPSAADDASRTISQRASATSAPPCACEAALLQFDEEGGEYNGFNGDHDYPFNDDHVIDPEYFLNSSWESVFLMPWAIQPMDRLMTRLHLKRMCTTRRGVVFPRKRYTVV